MRNRFSRAGFTLIELLIVVAIIGILAAIAIPNFLQAQVRAKVSRSVADLRTISLAIEQYNLDWDVYPRDYFWYWQCQGQPAPAQGPFWDLDLLLHCLTTPIEYLSTVPSTDPFGDGVASTANGKYIYVNSAEQPWWTYKCLGGPVAPRYVWISKPDMVGFKWPRFYWNLKASGPDRTHEWWGTWEQLYDPSNGTVSPGEISVAGP